MALNLKLGKRASAHSGKEKIIHHFVFLEVPTEIVWPQVIAWGQAPWWPAKTAIKITPVEAGEPRVGAKFRYKIRRLLAPSWDAEISKLEPESLLERRFLNGPLDGYEAVKVEWRYNGTRIDYELHYRVRGLIHKIFWPLLGEKIYTAGTKKIIESLRQYIVTQYKAQGSQ